MSKQRHRGARYFKAAGTESTIPMPRFTVSATLHSACALLILAMLALACAVWWLMGAQVRYTNDVLENRVPQIERAAQLELMVFRISLQVRHAMLARNPQELQATLDDIHALKKQLDQGLKAFGDGMTTDAGRKAFEPLPGLVANFWAVGGENLKLLAAGDKEAAFAFLVDKTIPARKQLLDPLHAELERQHGRTRAELTEAVQEAQFARNLVLGVVLMVSAGLVALTIYLVRILRDLGGEPAALRRAAEAVAAGDLAMPIALRPGDRGSVMAALKAMADSLARTVQAVRQSADHVAQASAEMASGNTDLSRRTEQQASALQQTAASMEQLGSTVRQNADNAKLADELAAHSAGVAAQGGALVRDVVGTMKDIQGSSRKISDIISVIDSIAFQTNILALNAAVEAARAGEQGRGFAVVASEVRTLAQRSAAAAREIKLLIVESVSRVDQGSSLVDQAGARMEEIVTAIQRVNAVVAEISRASREQSEGVSTVGEAVTRLDQGTQQNAALVEQGAAAAESLHAQSQELVRAVAVFRLT
jgi:methyl-accepting chemotaxis protein